MNNSAFKIGDTFLSKKHNEFGIIVKKEYKERLSKASRSESYRNQIEINNWLYTLQYLSKNKRYSNYYENKLSKEFERVDRNGLLVKLFE